MVQKTSVAGYRALGKEVSSRTGYQLPGATPTYDPLGSSSVQRHDDDYDDFWADNGVSDTDVKKPESASFVGQKTGVTQSKTSNSAKDAKDDDWENW